MSLRKGGGVPGSISHHDIVLPMIQKRNECWARCRITQKFVRDWFLNGFGCKGEKRPNFRESVAPYLVQRFAVRRDRPTNMLTLAG